MLGALDGNGFGWNEAESSLDESEEQGRLHELTEEYGFDVALGIATGIIGPEAAVAYGAFEAGDYAAGKAENLYGEAKDKASEIYKGAFEDEYGAISLDLFDDENTGVTV